MSSSLSSETRAEPNLTPLLDVVFQLITFFMLVINFSNDNHDQRIKLPVTGSARPIDNVGKVAEDRIVLNIDSTGSLLFNGKTFSTAEAIEQMKLPAALVRLNIKAGGIMLDPTGALPTRIVIRGDRDMSFGPLYQIMTACQNNGFQKFEFMVMSGS